jgi:hypothetical protein
VRIATVGEYSGYADNERSDEDDEADDDDHDSLQSEELFALTHTGK